MDKATNGINCCSGHVSKETQCYFPIADDMVIHGKTDLEHDKHLINFLNICRKNTLMLNPDKMQFRLPQVSFFGHQWSAKGLSLDPKMIAAVKRMDLPGDVETM